MVVDSDGGVDDAVALTWLLDRDDVEVVAVTAVWGNVGVEQAARNLRIVLERGGAGDVPVHVGAAGPLLPAPPIGVADFVHGVDGLADVGLPDPTAGPVDEGAVDALLRLAADDLTLLTLGPLTNVAAMLERDAEVASRWGDVVVMGGASVDAGNALPGAEANVAHDPRAAAAVVSAAWTTPPLLVGLDATHTATFGPDEVALLDAAATEAAAFCAPLLAFYRRMGGSFCSPGECPCHDLLAAMAVVEPGVVEVADLPAAVVTEPGPAWGHTVVDRRWLAWRRSDDFHEQGAPDGMAMVRWAVRGDATAFRSLLHGWWS